MLAKTNPTHAPSNVLKQTRPFSLLHPCTVQSTPSGDFLLLRRHAHIRINRRTKRRKTRAPSGRRLRTSLRTENPTRDTTSSDTVGQIILRPEPLDAALGARVQGTDDTEVLSGGPRTRAHVFEAVAELLAPGKVGDLAALGCERGVVGHLL